MFNFITSLTSGLRTPQTNDTKAQTPVVSLYLPPDGCKPIENYDFFILLPWTAFGLDEKDVETIKEDAYDTAEGICKTYFNSLPPFKKQSSEISAWSNALKKLLDTKPEYLVLFTSDTVDFGNRWKFPSMTYEGRQLDFWIMMFDFRLTLLIDDSIDEWNGFTKNLNGFNKLLEL